MDSTSSVWLAVCAVLVLALLTGFALITAGRARAKNAVHALVQVGLGIAVVCLAQWLVGTRLSLGASAGGWFGNGDPAAAGGPLVWAFQALTAAVSLVIVCAATAERVRLAGVLAFAAVLGGVIQPVVWHWTQHPGGWLVQLGFVDATGAASLQLTGAACALAALWVTGPRLGRYGPAGDLRRWPAHHLPMVAIGSAFVWLGWLGLVGNKATDTTALGLWIWNSLLGASAGACVAAGWNRLRGQHWAVDAGIHGGLAGWVALSACALTVGSAAAVFVGAVAGALSVGGAALLQRLRIDDASDATAVHGAAALWGLWAAVLLRQEGPTGTGLLIQTLGALATIAWSFPLAYGALRLIDRLLARSGGLRIEPRDEMAGLDYLDHRATAYPERADSIAAIKLES